MDYRFHNYNKNLKHFARELRSRTATKAERFIWKSLLCKEQTGLRFLRQRPVHTYIVDFFCPTLLLIVEIDGSSHIDKDEYDRKRQDKLEALVCTILRFSEGDVLNNLCNVEQNIRNVIYSLENK